MASTTILVDPRISKVFTDGHFLCIKGNNKTTTNQIQRTLLRLKPTFDEGKKANVFIESLYEGKLLACKPKWDDKGYWFRCQMVHKNEYLTSGMVCVKLTEYEQELNLPLNLLRDLTSFSIDELIQPAQLILYYIDGVYSPTGWSPDLLQALQSFLTTNSISLRPTFQCRNFNFARVFVNDVNLAEHIKNKGLGCVIESNKLMVVAEEYFRQRETGREPNAVLGRSYHSPSPDFGMAKGSRDTAFANSRPEELDNGVSYAARPQARPTIPENAQQRSQQQALRKMSVPSSTAPPNLFETPQFAPAPPPQPAAAASIKTPQPPPPPPTKTASTQSFLSANNIHEVRISHIENSAKLFYVQVKNQLDMITELSKRMEHVPLQQPDFLQEGSVYLVKQGNVVCRGLLVSADPFRARLIDFGNIVNTDYKDLWELPTPYDKVGQMAFRFSLAGFYSNPKLSFNSEAAEKFQSLVRVADEFQLKVVAADGPPSSQYCELYKNNASLLNILVEELSKPINYERQSLQANFEYEVFVSFIDTTSKTLPWTFYVQMASEKSRLDALSTEMMLVCGGSSAPANADQLAENAPVLAKYMGEWYRGQLLQKGSQNCAVYFVDYGNTDEQVPLNNLRMPTRSVVKQMPEQAFKCVLDGCSSNLKARDIMEQVLEDKEYSLTIVFKMENNTANVRLKEKDSDVYLNDRIIAKLWAQVNAPVEQITQPALEVSKPRLKVATPNELNQISTVPRVDLPPKRPEKELYSAPKAKKIISDWDNPSNNFFADKKNPDNHSTQVGGNSQPETINKQFSNYDVPDRSNLKRVSDSSDDWTSKRSHPPRNEFLQPPPPMKASVGEKFGSFDQLERKISSESGERFGSFDKSERNMSHGSGDKFSSFDNPERKMSFGNGSSNRSESANRGRDNDRRDNRGGQGQQWRSGSGDRQGREDRFDNSRGSTGGSKFGSWGDKSKGGSDFQTSGNRSDQKSNQDFQGAASQEKWKPRTQETQGGTTATGFNNRNGFNNEKRGNFTGTTSSGPIDTQSNDSWGDGPSAVTAKKLSPKIPAYPTKIGERQQAMIVYMKSPNDFYIQPVAIYTKIEEMTASVTTEFQAGSPPLSEVFEGDFCWAKYPDDSIWYRAYVLAKAGENWKVTFVDYGNTSEVSIADMRPLKEEHASLPAQSINCLLRGCDKSDWPKEEVDKFDAATQGIELDVTFVAKLKDKISVVLCKESECINTQLGASDESLAPLKTIKPQTLEVDSTHDNMTVSWFFDPKCILMHRSESCESLNSKLEVKEDSLPRLPIINPEVGTLVHIEVSKKLLRGLIVAAKDTKFKVQLVDYGRIVILNLDGLNALPEEFVTHPRQAIVCSIKDVEPAGGKGWPKASSDKTFEAIFKSCKTFTINVKSVQDDGKLDVVMTRDDGKDVADLLRQGGFAVPLKVETKSVERAVPNTEWKVYVSVYDSHMKFFVQKESEATKLAEYQTKLQEIHGPALTEISVGQLILAKAEDGVWYRASVLKSEPIIEVFMMDYGDVHTVTETKALPQVFAEIPLFATCCCLPMAAIPDKYTALQEKVEAELFGDVALTMHITALANAYLVVDFKSEQSSLIQDRITEGLAIRTIFEGYVSNITSLEGVDVQNVLWADKIEAMAKTLEGAESYPLLVNARLGTHCVAKFEDGVFYRAQITSQADDLTEVCFYDYGNSAQVTDMRQMPDEVLKVPQLSQLVNVCNPPKSEEICDKMMEMLSDGTVKFEILMLNPTSFPLDVVIFKDGIDLRKLATPGLNVMSTEFSPQPLDLVKMLSDMSEGKIKKLKEVEVEVEREDGDVSLEVEKEPMECDPAASAQEVEKEMEEGFKTEENKMEEGPAPDALIPAETVDKTEKIADSVEKMEEVNIPADVVEKEEMNVSTDNVEKEDEMNVSETEVKETTPVKQEKVEPPVSEEEVGDAAMEEEQSVDDIKPEEEIPTAPKEEIEKNEVATETSVATDDADSQQVEDAAEELDEEIETSATSVIENPAVTTEATPEVISEEKLEVAAEEVQRDQGDVSLDVEIEKEQMECDPVCAKEVENEATPENIEQPKVHTPEKEELVVEKTESPTKEDTPDEEDRKTPPFSKSIEFSSPEACPGMDHSSFLMDSDIALQNSDAESHSSFTFQVPLPVRLFGNDDKTSSAHSSNMSLDSMDNRGGNQATELEERMPQNGGGDADEESGDIDVPIKRATLDFCLSTSEVSGDDKETNGKQESLQTAESLAPL